MISASRSSKVFTLRKVHHFHQETHGNFFQLKVEDAVCISGVSVRDNN